MRDRAHAGVSHLLRAAGLAVIVLLAWTAHADAYIFWTNALSSTTGAVGRANLDASGITQKFASSVTGNAMAVDMQHVFWTTGTSIAVSTIDGLVTNTNLIPVTGSNGVTPDGLADNGQYIYFGEDVPSGISSNDTIVRANLDGSGVTTLVTGISGNIDGIAVSGQYIYWTNFWASTIGRANLDGTQSNPSFMKAGCTPMGIAVDSQHLYWDCTYNNTIARANLDGSGLKLNFIVNSPTSSGGNQPVGVAVDGQHIYWTNGTSGTIGRANVDGSGVNESYVTGATSPQAVAVNPPPLATTPPTISGSAVQGATLSEGHGIWTNSPVSYSYQWLRCDASGNRCSPIGGATGQTYVPGAADAGSTLRVQEIAANPIEGAGGAAASAATAVVPALSRPPLPVPVPIPVPVVHPAVASLSAVSSVGPSASLLIACSGRAGQVCAGPVVLTATPPTGHASAALAGAARKKHRKPKKGGARPVTVGGGSYSVAAGRMGALTLTLNATGRRLLSTYYSLSATASFPGTSIASRTVRFAYKRINAMLFYTWQYNGSYTTALSITAAGLPRGAGVAIRCRGGGCPFARRVLAAKSSRLSLTPLFAGHRLSPGAVVTVTLDAPNSVGKVVIFRIRRDRAPTAAGECQPPGARGPVACRA